MEVNWGDGKDEEDEEEEGGREKDDEKEGEGEEGNMISSKVSESKLLK